MELVNMNSPVALYHQLKEILAQKIISNEWSVGDRLPTEFELCEQYGVSRITVRQALTELERDGLISRKQGVGTFVSIPKIEQSLTSFYSMSEEFRKRGLKPRTEVVEFRIESAERTVRKALAIEEGQTVYHIKRLRFADDLLMAIEYTYLPEVLFPNLTKAELDSNALYDVMRNRFGVVTSSARESFGAIAISKDDAKYFGLAEGYPALDLERFAYSGSDCVEYTRGVMRGDKFRFYVKLD